MLSHVRALSTENPSEATAAATPSLLRQAPLHIFTGHKDEGFALDWSPVNPGRLVTGITTIKCYFSYLGLPCLENP